MSEPTYSASVRFLDSTGKTCSVVIYVQSAFSLPADNLGQLGFIASQLDLLTEAQIIEITAKVPLIPSSVKSAPVAGSELSHGALIEMQRAWNGLPEYSLWVPAWIRGNFSGDVAIMPDAWHSTGVSVYWNAGGSPPFQSDRYGNSINAPQKAEKSFHALRRQIAQNLKR